MDWGCCNRRKLKTLIFAGGNRSEKVCYSVSCFLSFLLVDDKGQAAVHMGPRPKKGVASSQGSQVCLINPEIHLKFGTIHILEPGSIDKLCHFLEYRVILFVEAFDIPTMLEGAMALTSEKRVTKVSKSKVRNRP